MWNRTRRLLLQVLVILVHAVIITLALSIPVALAKGKISEKQARELEALLK